MANFQAPDRADAQADTAAGRGRAHRPRAAIALAAVATAALATSAVVGGVAAVQGLGLTGVGANPRGTPTGSSFGLSTGNQLSPELIESIAAQGSNPVENPGAGVGYYGYLGNGPLLPYPGGPTEAQKTEPDKNTYLVLDHQHGPDPSYNYGTHFLFQGHEVGSPGYITRVNLDADPAHRVTLLATADTAANPLPDFDGSVWDPFTQTLLFSAELGTAGGLWQGTPDWPSQVTDISGIVGRGGYEGIQLDSDGNIWIVEDSGGKTGSAGNPATINAKQPNSFIYRFVPTNRGNLSAGGKLQVLQVDGKNGLPSTFTGGAAPTQAQADADITSTFMHDLHVYGNTFTTRWLTIHDTAVDGTSPYEANLLAKTKGGTPFKRPENGQFQPNEHFGEFFFTETGDTNATSGANASFGGWGGVLHLSQKNPSSTSGTLSPFFLGDMAHTGFDNLAFLDHDDLVVVEDAGDTLHAQRNALDSAYALRVDAHGGTPTPLRMIGEGRDPSATIDAANAGFGRNEGDNEITGIHVSDGDPSVKDLIGTKSPQPWKGEWRVFWTQQHGDNVTWEISRP